MRKLWGPLLLGILWAAGPVQGLTRIFGWNYAPVAVDRTFELQWDATAKTIVLQVKAPSILVQVGF